MTRDADRTARRELVLTRMPISIRGFLSRNLRGMRMLAMTIARRCGRHARTVRWQASEYAEVDGQVNKQQKKTVPAGRGVLEA